MVSVRLRLLWPPPQLYQLLGYPAEHRLGFAHSAGALLMDASQFSGAAELELGFRESAFRRLEPLEFSAKPPQYPHSMDRNDAYVEGHLEHREEILDAVHLRQLR